MTNTRLHIQDHFKRRPQNNYGGLFANTTGSKIVPPTEMNSAMHPRYNTGPGAHASSQEHFGMVPTQTSIAAIVIPYERNGHPSYDITQNNSASNNTYNTMASQLALPSLARIVPIPLPPLSPNIPIQTHALITYRPSSTAICWNISLPPATAHPAFSIGGQASNPSRWTRDVAVTPRTLSSITIRIRGVARPVVVFPIEAGRPIKIIDILRAVYGSMRAIALEYGVSTMSLPVYVPSSGSRDLPFEDVIAAEAIQRHFNNRVWWNGLSQSMNEVDVWVLHLRGPSRGRFRRPSTQSASGRG